MDTLKWGVLRCVKYISILNATKKERTHGLTIVNFQNRHV